MRSNILYKTTPILFVFAFFFFCAQSVAALTLTPVRLEISGDPGEVLNKEMTLINERMTAETYYVSYGNFEAQGETGNPTFVEAKDDVGTWIEAPESIFLAPGTSKVVPLKITIPKTAEPGGHFGAIFWGTAPTAVAPGEVSIGAKTTMLVLLRVNGAISEKGGVLEFATKNKQTLYTSLPVEFYYRFENAGTDRIKPAGAVKIRNMIGITAADVPGNPVEGNILPKSVRKFETIWQGKDGTKLLAEGDDENFFDKVKREYRNFGFGRYTAQLKLTYGADSQVARSTFSFWVLPWHLLIVVLVLLFIVSFVLFEEVRAYNRWIIKKARMQFERMQQNIKRPRNRV